MEENRNVKDQYSRIWEVLDETEGDSRVRARIDGIWWEGWVTRSDLVGYRSGKFDHVSVLWQSTL